ncbi:MOSC domain-containing protein [Roseibium denhamense]|uniref:MOSC domain-containing protein n=1 Tax=Roseibium denhamense TaxID=76305 RepID=A0ABY1PHA2_9HYPH|nr:MOSC domain-containing protein [Roseibium denhamense]MTI04724.1 MOSC domain-containing protein [Roseibium denhamense]SMP33650.1 hypothetical protein SAMN06265374_3810 [Roseibium denhamense]
MKLQALWRYPVKSLQGEALDHAFVEARGISGDRQYAVLDANGKLGSGKSTSRFQKIEGLLSLSAETRDGAVSIRFPDGSAHGIDDIDLPQRLSGYLGQAVTIVRENRETHFDDGAIHIVLSSELAKLQALLPEMDIDARRFRPNLVLDAPAHMTSDTLIGRVLSIGGTHLKITHKTERCVMVTMEQGDLPKAPLVLRQVSKAFDLDFGVYAAVLKPGTVQAGQSASISSGTFNDGTKDYGF